MNIIAISSWNSSKASPSRGVFLIDQLKSMNFKKVYFIKDTDLKINTVIRDGNLIYINCRINQSNSFYSNVKRLIFYNYILIKLLYIKSLRIDHVLINVVYHIGLMVSVFLFLSRIKYHINEHWSGYLKKDGSFDKLSCLVRLIIKLIFKYAKKVYVPSDYLKNQLAINLDLKKSKIYIYKNPVYNHIYSSNICGYKERLKIDILTIGSLNDVNKRVSGILEFLGNILRLRDELFTVVVIGTGFNNSLLDISNMAFNCKVIFISNVDNRIINRYYNTCNTYISNSLFETFSISIFQNLLFGNKTLSTNSGGPMDYLNNEICFLFERENLYSSIYKWNHSQKRLTTTKSYNLLNDLT